MPYGSTAERRAKWPYEPERIHRWEQGPSSATVMVLSPHVVVTEVIGSFVSDAIDTVKPPIQQLMARSGAAHVFWDAEGLESHDGPVRDEFVGLFRNNRSQWAGLHVLFRSALIGMTVGAVGLLFRGALKGHRDRDSFRKAIDAALASE